MRDHPVVVVPLDGNAERAARARQAQLLKPPGSLGRLEDLAVWMAAVSGDPLPHVRARVVIAAADHGVAADRVSAYPQEVTRQMLAAFIGGGSAISALAREAGAEVVVVDAGVAASHDAEPPPGIETIGLPPARHIAHEAALATRDLDTALAAGRRLAADAARRGATVLLGGDMGIGNTTPAACLAAWLTGRPGAELCGRGTGVDDEGLARKRAVVERALALHAAAAANPLDALRRLGGGDIAVLCGLALGAAEQGLGYVCDGVIATAAAAVAAAHAPAMHGRLLAGHRSPEPAHGALLEHLGLEPVLDLRMRLGEASGGAAALAILRLACTAHRDMATFDEARVSSAKT